MEKISLSDALLYSLIGIGIVFAVLLVLIIVISVMSALLKNKNKYTAVPVVPVAANGSTGEVSKFDVPDKTAAMIMAIVADKTGIPMNRLRFISIKEIKDGDDEQ